MSITQALQLVYAGTLLATAAYVFPKGGRAERWTLAWLLVCSVLTLFVESPRATRWQHTEYAVMLVDLLLLVALTVIMLRSRRLWPIPATAVQLVAVITHVAMMIDRGIVPRVYSWALGFWAYPIMALVVIGTARASRARRPLP